MDKQTIGFFCPHCRKEERARLIFGALWADPLTPQLECLGCEATLKILIYEHELPDARINYN